MKSDTFAPVPNRGLITISIVLANIMQGVDNSKRRTAAAGPTRSPQVRQVIGKLDELRIVERLQHLQHYRLVSVVTEQSTRLESLRRSQPAVPADSCRVRWRKRQRTRFTSTARVQLGGRGATRRTRWDRQFESPLLQGRVFEPWVP